MNWLDFLFLGILVFTIVRGAFRGVVREVLGIVAVVAAYLMAGLLYNEVGDTFAGVLTDSNARAGTAYALTFGALAVLFALVAWFLDSVVKRIPNLGPLNQAAGILFGGLKGALLVSVILLSLRWFPNAEDTLDDSTLTAFFEPVVDTLADHVDQVIEALPEAVAPIVDR